MPRRHRVALVLAAAASATVAAPSVPAHLFQFDKVDLVRLERDRLRFDVRFTVPVGAKAADLRRRHDLDGDGTLAADEAAALGAELGREAIAPLIVTLDGASPGFRGPTVDLPGLDRAAASTRPVEARIGLEADLRLDAGDHVLAIADQAPGGGGLVPLRLTPGEGVSLVSFPSQAVLGPRRLASGTFRIAADPARPPEKP